MLSQIAQNIWGFRVCTGYTMVELLQLKPRQSVTAEQKEHFHKLKKFSSEIMYKSSKLWFATRKDGWTDVTFVQTAFSWEQISSSPTEWHSASVKLGWWLSLKVPATGMTLMRDLQ